MSYNPQNPNGQATSANSEPVVIASDQSTVPVSVSGVATASNQTNGTQQAKVTDGTNIVNVLKSDGTAAGQNAQMVAPSYQSQTFSFTSVTAGTAYDVGDYKWVSVQITGFYSGSTTPTITFQTSNDNSNWYSQVLVNSPNSNSAGNATATAAGLYMGNIGGRYFRLNQTGTYTSGTTTGTIVFSTLPGSSQSVGIYGQVTGTGAGITGTITTSSSSISEASYNGNGGFASVSVHGTYAGVSFGITVSDDSGTTYYNAPIYDTTAQAWLAPGTTISPGTNASKTYWVPVMPNNSIVKVLASAYTSGTANVRISHSLTGTPGSSLSQIMDAAGNSRGANVTASNALQVDGSAVTQPVSGTVTANAGTNMSTSALALESGGNLDDIDANTDLLAASVVTALDTTTAPTKLLVVGGESNDGTAQYNPVPLGAGGRSVIIEGYSGGTTVPVSGTVAVTESGTWNVGASTATGSAVPANAFYQGVNPQTSLPTAATAGNLTGATADKFGRQVVLSNAIRDIMGTQTTTITASTSETPIITAAASTFNDLVSVFISNTSATAARVDIRDTTGGSVIFQLYVPAGDMRGLSLATPWPQTSVNTNWTATSSAPVTDLRISALFIKNK